MDLEWVTISYRIISLGADSRHLHIILVFVYCITASYRMSINAKATVHKQLYSRNWNRHHENKDSWLLFTGLCLHRCNGLSRTSSLGQVMAKCSLDCDHHFLWALCFSASLFLWCVSSHGHSEIMAVWLGNLSLCCTFNSHPGVQSY